MTTQHHDGKAAQLPFDINFAYSLDEPSGTLAKIQQLIISSNFQLEPFPFEDSEELIDLVILNESVLFGNKTILLELSGENNQMFPEFFQNATLLLDFRSDNPLICLIMAKPLMGQVQEDFYLRMTEFFALKKDSQAITGLSGSLQEYIKTSEFLQEKLKVLMETEEIGEVIDGMIKDRLYCILLIDACDRNLINHRTAYPEAWVKLTKVIQISKYSFSTGVLCAVVPMFTEKPKSTRNKLPKENYTEEDHLNGVSDEIRESYNRLKEELLSIDPELTFNPQRYYIAVKKNRNFLFFNIGKKKITLTVVHPEEETRKVIKKHEIKTLTEKVQSFYNGPSCGVIIENLDNLKEVVNLLKKVVGKQ